MHYLFIYVCQFHRSVYTSCGKIPTAIQRFARLYVSIYYFWVWLDETFFLRNLRIQVARQWIMIQLEWGTHWIGLTAVVIACWCFVLYFVIKPVFTGNEVMKWSYSFFFNFLLKLIRCLIMAAKSVRACVWCHFASTFLMISMGFSAQMAYSCTFVFVLLSLPRV